MASDGSERPPIGWRKWVRLPGLGDHGPVVLEVDSSPGLEGFLERDAELPRRARARPRSKG